MNIYIYIYFFPIGCPGVGGCPNPRVSRAYPKAGPADTWLAFRIIIIFSHFTLYNTVYTTEM